MFWKLGGFAFKDAIGIDSLLERPANEITLEKVLDEEDLLQEIKVHNARLLDYLRQESVLARLLDLIIEEYKDDEKKGFKYAFVACEVLSCEVWSICETIFENPQLLHKFWTFIDAEPPLNPLRASYFTKVNEKFLEKKTEEMIPFIQSIPNVLSKILRHSDTSAIMDLLLKIISMERTDVGAGVVEWLYDEGLLTSLTAHLQPDVDPDIQTTVADVIKAIIAISANSNDQGVIGPNALSRSLVSGLTISNLVSNMIRTTESGTNASLTTGVSIVIELIRKNNSDYDLTPILALVYSNQPPTSRDPIYLGTMLRVFANSVAEFQALLLSPKNVRMIKTSGYGEIESLGFERFRICELYAELLHCSNMALLNDIRGEQAVKERDAERERLKEIAKADGQDGSRRSLHLPNNTDDAETEKDSSSAYGRRSTSSGRGSICDVLDEVEDAFLVEKEQSSPGLSPVRSERLRRSSSEERRGGPEERRNSRGSMDEESRPYMPAIQSHVIDGVPVQLEEQSEEQKIIADIGPQAHPVPKPETAVQEMPQSLTAPDLRGESAILSRTPSPPPNAAPGDPSQTFLINPPSTIEEDISNATHDSIVPDTIAKPVVVSAASDVHVENTNKQNNIDLPKVIISTDTESTSHDVASSDHSDTLSITSTSSSQAQGEPIEPVIGDFLKMQFMKEHVISTILELFFKFPWNNFLHNVVYDVVQQVFNGPMDRGYNRVLAIDVFAQGKLCEKIVAGQKASDEHVHGDGVRLGYMGHLTLIAEEVVKFVERYPPQQISPLIVEKVNAPEWIDYVDNILSATRARDSAVLGGERPQVVIPQQQQMASSMQWDIGDRSYDAEEDDEELQRRLGQFTVADEAETSDQFTNYISQQISNEAPDKFGSSDEEDEDDDQELSVWLSDRGDFLRSRSFDRYENSHEEQIESLDDTNDNMTFDDHGDPEIVQSAEHTFYDISNSRNVSHGEAVDSEESSGPSHATELSSMDEREEDEERSDLHDRSPTPEGGPLPQSASPAPSRRSIDDDEEEREDIQDQKNRG